MVIFAPVHLDTVFHRIARGVDVAVVHHVLHLAAAVLHGLLCGRPEEIEVVILHLREGGQPELDVHLARILRAERILLAKIEACRRRDHDEHHRRQNADGRQPRAVALHAIGHRGDGDKVVCAVVIPLILLQHAAEQHRRRNHQQVRRENDQNHRHKEPCDRVQRVFDRHGQIIRRAEQDEAQQAEKPVGPRRLLTRGLAAQEGHGGASSHTHHRHEPEQRVDHREAARCAEQGREVEREGQRRRAAHHLHDGKLNELGEQHAEEQPARNDDGCREQRLPGEDARKVALAHAEDVVEAEFAPAPPDEEGVCVKQENHRKDQQHDVAERHDHAEVVAAGERPERIRPREGRENVADRRHQRAHREIRPVHAAVLPHPVDGEAGIEGSFHFRSPPVASTVSVPAIFS